MKKTSLSILALLIGVYYAAAQGNKFTLSSKTLIHAHGNNEFGLQHSFGLTNKKNVQFGIGSGYNLMLIAYDKKYENDGVVNRRESTYTYGIPVFVTGTIFIPHTMVGFNFKGGTQYINNKGDLNIQNSSFFSAGLEFQDITKTSLLFGFGVLRQSFNHNNSNITLRNPALLYFNLGIAIQ